MGSEGYFEALGKLIDQEVGPALQAGRFDGYAELEPLRTFYLEWQAAAAARSAEMWTALAGDCQNWN